MRLLDHVPEVLAEVGATRRLILITKGDLIHQTHKVTTSGLAHHFEHVEIVLEKDPETYSTVLSRLGIDPTRFCMVGNSVRSDILPVLALGGHGVHVPYPILWDLEHVDHDQHFVELGSLADLPAWLAGTLIQRRRSDTSVTRWSGPLRSISAARDLVGAMFSRRFLPLISRQMNLATSTASSGDRSA